MAGQAQPTAVRVRRTRPVRARVNRPGSWVAPLVTAVALIGAVQVLVAAQVIPGNRIPLPTAVGVALAEELTTSKLWSGVLLSLRSWAFGLGLAVVLAVPFGALAGANRFVFRSVQFLVDFLRPIPSVALLPLLVLLFGVNSGVNVSLAVLGAFFPLFFATLYGVGDTDPVKNETAMVYQLDAGYRFFFITLPSAVPYIATGMRLAATNALLLVIGTEMVVGIPGLGRAIVDAQYAGNLPVMYARIVAAGALGLLITSGFLALERRFLRWHSSQQGDAA